MERKSDNDINIRYSTENFVRYKNQVQTNKKSLDRIDEVSAMIDFLKEEMSEKVDKKDLDTALYSYLTILDDNFKSIEEYVKNANKNELIDFKKNIFELYGIVNNLLDEEIPKYRKQIKKGEVFVSEQIEEISNNVSSIRDEIQNKLNDIAEVIDSNLEYFNKKINENIDQVNESIQNCNILSNSLNERILKDNNKIIKLESKIDNYKKGLTDIKSDIVVNAQHIKNIINEVDEKLDHHIKDVDQNLQEQLKNINLSINEYVDEYLENEHQNLVLLKEEVFSEIKNLPIGNIQKNIKKIEEKINFIRETYSNIKTEDLVREVISETTLSEPPSVNNSDPLTPLDKKFVTIDQLQEHYRLFLNRVQQQLSTIGGGGETQLKYLDDIVGIATNASAYDGQYLSYDHSLGKFVFATPAADYSVDNWVDGINGVYTQTNVGIGSTVPQVALDIVGDVNISGVATATDFDSLSDIKLKTNVVIITDPLAKVQQLRGVNFEWKENNRPSMGVIAQEVAEVLPQLVHGYETKTVNYNGLIGLLIECVKKQQEEIEELKKRLP